MGNISNRLYKVIFFGPLIILILERILGSVSFVHTPDFGVLSSDLSSFAAPHEISRPSLRKEVYRLQQIERHDERLTSQEALDYESEQRLKKEMAGEFVADESNQSDLIPLNDLVDMAEQITCDEDHRKVEDKHLPYERLFDDLKIPRIVHQTSRTRCLTKKLWNIVQSWSLGPDWAHYLHSDHAVDRLFQKHWPEFPHLSLLLQCLENKGTLKADLWRYLVLWEYGGVYADVDTKPNLFNHSTITSQDDGFFIVEQYHLLSQYFMATSPRHRK
jgi:mannosyltransferase OCH1-like enzyme